MQPNICICKIELKAFQKEKSPKPPLLASLATEKCIIGNHENRVSEFFWLEVSIEIMFLNSVILQMENGVEKT